MNAPEKPTIKHRIVMPIQTRGGIGKSTEAIARAEWMNHREVDWAGYDLDQFNRTLSTAFSNNVDFVEIGSEPESAIHSILRKVVNHEVTLVDPSAHMNQAILRAMEMSRFTQIAEKAQVRATILLFPFDEVSDMEDIATTVETLGDTVDWVVVRNQVRLQSTRFFDHSPLEARLQSYGAAFLEMPALLADTRNHLRAHEVRLERGLSPSEILRNNQIDLLHRIVFEDWLVRTLFKRFDAIASHLLPTVAASNISPPPDIVTAPARKRGAMMNFKAWL